MRPTLISGVFIGLLLLGSNGLQIHLAESDNASIEFRSPVAHAADFEVTPGPSPYDVEVIPLAPADCGRCHGTQFGFLKNEGGRHKKVFCTQCHREFHAYNPRKQNFEQIMPKCAWCHKNENGGPFHGDNEAITTCLNCHQNPHKPLAIPLSAVEPNCKHCHPTQRRELDEFPSAHRDVVEGCPDCHDERHGNIPVCFKCHESHSPAVELTFQDCLSCHPVHKPLQITPFTEKTDMKICAGCHGEPYTLLHEKVTKHTTVGCPRCHQKHGQIPECQTCHGIPHSQKILQDVTKCTDCHGHPHSLNVD